MPLYAQTIIQLYNQLQNDGYSKSDLIKVRDTYNLAMSVFSSHYQPSGKTFLSHGIGTASILAFLKQPSTLISAGLIHNIYMKGDFGTGKNGISNGKRKYMTRTLGKEIEEYVAGFAQLQFNPEKLLSDSDSIHNISQIERAVSLLYLADHLEHLLDHDVLYYSEQEHRRYTENNRIDAKLAYKLNFPLLGSEIERMSGELDQIKVPIELIDTHTHSYTIPPGSYRKRFPVWLIQELYYFRSKVKIRKILRSLLKPREK